MPATIAALLRRADLGMTLLAGEAAPALTAPIRWVTTSELADPTPYLRGGELLLTTGMRFKSTRSDVAQYVSRLADAGVLGVGIGIGRDLAFRRPPARLVAAAAERGLPLLLVDEPTPFIAIGEAVAQLHLADETAALAQALRGQQAITRAAVTEGAGGVARRLAALLDGWVVVTDFEGNIRYEALPGAGGSGGAAGTSHPDGQLSASATSLRREAQPELPAIWRTELDRLRRGRGGAAALVTPGEHISIQVLGEVRTPDERPLGFLVTGRPAPPTTAHHSMTNVAAALLTVGSGLRDSAARQAGEAAHGITSPGRQPAGARTPGERTQAAGTGTDIVHSQQPSREAAILDALSRYQRRSRVRLSDSLRVWLAHHGRIEPAAAELGIHRNTLRYRIMKAERLLGRDLDDPAARAALWAALSD